MDHNPFRAAVDHFRAGRLEAAADLCRAILARFPESAAANHLLGLIHSRQGKLSAARDCLARASAAPDATPEVHNNYGVVLGSLGDEEGAIAAFKRALALKSDFADALNNLGAMYKARGHTAEAIATLRRAATLKEGFAEAAANLREAYRDLVPPWHFAMMGDRARNDAYEAALGRAAKGRRVLDIGTGAGLLAMMAARAGAASVTSCESIGLIAERAREIIALNGLSERITVLTGRSTELAVGAGLAQRAELLVTEVFSSGLISEGVLPTIEHAHAQLLTPDAIVIPRAASAMAYLIGGPVIEDMLFAGKTKGFDLSPFNDFAPPMMDMVLYAVPHEVLSDDFELIRFDFRAKLFPMGARPLSVTATKAGVCVGLVQWIRLELDSETRYENRPSRAAEFNGHWSHVLYRFPKRVPVAPGDVIRLNVRHDRKHIAVDLA